MFEPIDFAAAQRMLATESGVAAAPGDTDTAALLGDMAGLLGGEPPVLRWAAELARTMGWEPLRRRLVAWALPDARLPWHDAVSAAIAALPAGDAELLATLAACDAPFAWEVLEAVAPAASIESVVRLERAKLLRRATRDGVVTFLAPYSVRAFHRVAGPIDASGWLAAWLARAEDLRASSYGPRSRATLVELAAAIPLAARALSAGDAPTRTIALALWLAASDAVFFGDALAYDAPAFMRAVEVADAVGEPALRVRARVVAGRALLERGDAAGASALLGEAASSPGVHRADVLRGRGWVALSLTDFDAARSAFEQARALTAEDPRAQADATAGLGVLALLAGDPSAARGLLEEAVAIHVVMRDAPREAAVRGMMELLPEARDVAADEARIGAQVDEFRANGQRWREALALARLAIAARARGDAAGERARLNEARAAATLARMPASNVVRALLEATEARPFVVGAEGRSLALPSGETHDLTRHGPVRRILWALAVARVERPGAALRTVDMIEAGWPGEKMQHEAGTLRVYTTIRRLRSLGLADALLTRDDGYLVDPSIHVTLA